MASSPGKAQDLLVELERWKFSAHREIVHHARMYATLGAKVPLPRVFRGLLGREEVLLWPPRARDSRALAALERPRFLYPSAWATRPEQAAALRCDRLIPLAEEADHAALLAHIQAVAPKRVYLTAGPMSFVEELRRRGCEADLLGSARQMDLFAA
jgi:hypothetical protein